MLPISPIFANRWLTALPSLWLLGAGACVAIVSMIVIWGIMRACNPRLALEAKSSLQDGFLGPYVWLLVALSAVAIAFTPLVPLPSMSRSLVRLVTGGEVSKTITIQPNAKLQSIPLDLRPQELQSLTLESSDSLVVRTQQAIEGFALTKAPDIDLVADTPWTWERSSGETNPFLGQGAQLEATNQSDAAVPLTVLWSVAPEHTQVALFPISAIVFLAIAIVYMLFRLIPRRVAAIASATAKEALGQPIFSVALIAGAVLLVAFIVIPYNTFGEDVKMLKDSGLTLIKVLSLLVVVWTASVAVSEEIEGRTAMTVLSKPVKRWQFVIGKYAGLVMVASLVFLILGSVLLSTTSLKVIYDARESSKTDPIWIDCANEMITVVPGLVLSFLETILLAAVSLAVSTRLSMVPNLIICFMIYALGHLVPLIVQSSVGKFAIVRFVGQLFATLLPVLEHFTIEAAVVGGVAVPWDYLGWASLYAGLYVTVALLIALVLFQDRDLA